MEATIVNPARRIEIVSVSKAEHSKRILAGRIITGFVTAFLLFDSITKLLKADFVVKASEQTGYPIALIPIIGTILLGCIIVYLFPRTSILGAVLLTGYLGGAVEANLRAGTPLFSNVLFPVYFGILVWAGLFLRKQRVREFFALTKANN
ncbi:MAG: DoxX family protein [Bacteroidota bacterium]|nr:DoxX family protein [Bacteroidota bacterium]